MELDLSDQGVAVAELVANCVVRLSPWSRRREERVTQEGLAKQALCRRGSAGSPRNCVLGRASTDTGARRRLAKRVDQGWTLTAAAEAVGVSVRCARKRVTRYRAEASRAQ
jgi:leucine-zipper of insertion element IS481